MNSHVQPPKGHRDVFEEELVQLETLQGILFGIARRNGYVRIETPTIESTTTYERTSAFSAEKCYTFSDKAGRSLVVRPDLNAPIARVIANNPERFSMPARLFFEGRVFRYRHNMKRSYRLFCLETFGIEDTVADADVLRLLSDMTNVLGFQSGIVEYSNLQLYRSLLLDVARQDERSTSRLLYELRFGTSTLRQELYSAYSIPASVRETLDTWLHAGDTHEENRSLLEHAERVHPQLHPVRLQMDAFENHLHDFGVHTPRLALSNLHGLGFYSGLTFRFIPHGCPEPLADGGRFDHMVSALGGQRTPATGIAFGMERLQRFMHGMNLPRPTPVSTPSLLLVVDHAIATRVRPLLPAVRERIRVVEALGLRHSPQRIHAFARTNGMTHVVDVRSAPDSVEDWIVRISSIASPSEHESIRTNRQLFHTNILSALHM